MSEDRNQRVRHSRQYADALLRLQNKPASEVAQAVLMQTALAGIPIMLYIGGPVIIARIFVPLASWRELSRAQRLIKVFSYTAGVVVRPVGWAALAGVAEVYAEDVLRVGPRHSQDGWGSDTTLCQAVTGGVAGSLVGLLRPAAATVPGRILGLAHPALSVVWYGILGAGGGVILPVIRYLLSHRGANLLHAGGHGLEIGIGQNRITDGVLGEDEEADAGKSSTVLPSPEVVREETVVDIDRLMEAAQAKEAEAEAERNKRV